MKTTWAFIFFCFITPTILLGQSPKKIEADLLKYFKPIQGLSDRKYQSDLNEDSLKNATDVFAAKLKAYTEKYPATITYPFKLLQKDNLNITTSTDGLLRIYSWDTGMGGSMYKFRSMVQYKTGQIVKSKFFTNADDFDLCYTSIYTFKSGNKTYYLCKWYLRESSRFFAEGINVFDIAKGQLNDTVKLIKTHSGMQSSISYEGDNGATYDPKSITSTITFDAANQIIKIPLITEKGKVTRRYITYKFTGKYFEKVKTKY